MGNGEIDTWVNSMGGKKEVYSRFLFENYDGIPIIPRKRYKDTIMMKIIR